MYDFVCVHFFSKKFFIIHHEPMKTRSFILDNNPLFLGVFLHCLYQWKQEQDAVASRKWQTSTPFFGLKDVLVISGRLWSHGHVDQLVRLRPRGFLLVFYSTDKRQINGHQLCLMPPTLVAKRITIRTIVCSLNE